MGLVNTSDGHMQVDWLTSIRAIKKIWQEGVFSRNPGQLPGDGTVCTDGLGYRRLKPV